MSAATRTERTFAGPTGTTLLALVQELTAAGGSEDEVVDRALALLESGRAHLTGNFRGAPVKVFRSG